MRYCMAKKTKKIVIVDSDAIFAYYNFNDKLNKRATNTFLQLLDRDYLFIYPISVIFEVISLFQRVLSSPSITAELIELIKNDQLFVHTISTEELRGSASLFNPAGSKKNSLIDCSVAILAKRLKAEGVFSFDEFYSKQGLKLAEDLTV